MKKIMFLNLIILLCIFSFSYTAKSLTANANVIIIVDPVIRWYHPILAEQCKLGGDNCIKIIVIQTSVASLDDSPFGGHLLQVPLSNIEDTRNVKDTITNQTIDSLTQTSYPSTANYIFPTGSTATIVECENENFKNISWDISNQFTDNNGKLSKYFPF